MDEPQFHINDEPSDYNDAWFVLVIFLGLDTLLCGTLGYVVLTWLHSIGW